MHVYNFVNKIKLCVLTKIQKNNLYKQMINHFYVNVMIFLKNYMNMILLLVYSICFR